MSAVDRSSLERSLMAAIRSIESRQRHLVHQHIARGEHGRHRNWAAANPGVVLVFCLVFIVAVGIIALIAYRYWLKRKAARTTYEAE